MKIKSLLLFWFLVLPFLGLTQKDMYEKGRMYYEAKQYNKALEYFYADKFGNSNKDLLIRRIISNYEAGKIENAKKDVTKILSFDNYPAETFFYIGKIYHSEGNYTKAAENYKNYIRLNSKAKNKKEVIHLIKQCGKARKLKYIEAEAFVDNYGQDINTEYDEFRMIQSPNYENKYYFSSAREGTNGGRRDSKGKRDDTFGTFNSDMYTIEKEEGQWREARALNPFINSSRNEIALDFSSDGSILFYMKGGSYDQGVIYTDTFAANKKETLEPTMLSAPIDASKGDTWLHLYNDKTILFASNRAGGYGGYDIYVTNLQDGMWSKPKNLGPGVNSKFDEISPCITNDGNILYFSTNREESFGGYDIFKSAYNNIKERWVEASNVGSPVNSAGNEIGFYISKDGSTASLSSDRKEGFGGFDLYAVYFKNQLVGQQNPVSELAFISKDEFIPSSTRKNVNTNRGSKAAIQQKKKEGEKENKVASTKTKEESKSSQKVESTISTPKKKELKPQIAEKAKSKTTKKTTTTEKSKSEEKATKSTPKQQTSTKKKTTGTKKSKKKSTKKKKSKKKKKKSPSSKKVKVKEYVINPVFYELDEDIINATARKELDVIASLMTQYESIQLDIRAHTVEDGMEAVDLYFSIKRAEQIAKYLVSKKINADRIVLKGYGSNYPIAKSETGGSKSKIASRVNSRIDFDMKGTDGFPIKVTMIEPYLAEYLRDPRGELFKTIEDGLSYRVQIASVGQMYQNQVLLLYNDSMIEKKMKGDSYKYTLGLYESYKDAQLLVKDLANYNVTGAFIVPYIDGRRISQSEYNLYTSQYPDLLKFTENKDE